MKRFLRQATVLFAVLVFSASVYSATVSTTGSITLIPPPSDVTLGALESNTEIQVFDEVQGLTLAADLAVNFGGVGGVISAGTMINSHFVHKDSIDSNDVTLGGTATFDEIILGIIASPGNLNASDPILGLAGTNYPTGLNMRGTLFNEIGDSIAFADNILTITLRSASRPDQLRVITPAPVPLPPAVLLLGSGMIVFGWLTRRRRY